MEQWKEMSETIKKRRLVPIFDCAYQGVRRVLFSFFVLFCFALLRFDSAAFMCFVYVHMYTVSSRRFYFFQFASGNPHTDAAAVRMFVDDGE